MGEPWYARLDVSGSSLDMVKVLFPMFDFVSEDNKISLECGEKC